MEQCAFFNHFRGYFNIPDTFHFYTLLSKLNHLAQHFHNKQEEIFLAEAQRSQRTLPQI